MWIMEDNIQSKSFICNNSASRLPTLSGPQDMNHPKHKRWVCSADVRQTPDRNACKETSEQSTLGSRKQWLLTCGVGWES